MTDTERLKTEATLHGLIIVTLPGGRRVEAQAGGHTLYTDQPITHGGQGTGISPFDAFLASIGACAGVFVQAFCSQRNLPTRGVRILERPSFRPDGALAAVDLEIQLPANFPEKYREAVVRVVDQCSVKRAIAAQPAFTVHSAIRPEDPAVLE